MLLCVYGAEKFFFVETLTNEESIWSCIAAEQGNGFWVKAEPQSHRQNKGTY